MAARPVSKFQYIPVLALALSFLAGGYLYNRTLDDWLTEIVSGYMLGLLEDVNHEAKEDAIHFYDLTPEEIDDFLDNLSQSSTHRRFTIIHESGKVLGDSKLTKIEINNLENYSQRPEVVATLKDGYGISKRFSDVTSQEVLYVAARLSVEDEAHDRLMLNEIPVNHDHDHDLGLDHDHEHGDITTQNDNPQTHPEHSSIYIIRVAMPTTSLHSMSKDLRFIIYMLMGGSMGVLIASSWFSQRKVVQVVDEERQQQQMRIDKSTRDIELLRQLANMLAACKDLNEAQLVVKDLVPRLLGNVSGCISIMRESQNLLEVEITWGEVWPAAKSFSPKDCWAMKKGKPHLTQDENQNLSCAHMGELAKGHNTLCIPLTAHGNSIGILHLNFSDSVPHVSNEAKQLALTLAEHLGLAFANLQLQEKLRSQALRDPLTGLYNRRYFEDKLESEWSKARQNTTSLSIIMLDLDHFKRFNDNFGHDSGDYVLKEVGNLVGFLINEQSKICRLGGEEFAVVYPNASSEEAMALAEKIVEEVRRLHLTNQGVSLGQLGISAGIATYPEQKVTSDKLLKLADIALYKAKKNGRSKAMHVSQIENIED